MSRRKQRSAFDQVSEFDRGRIVAYRDCGLSFREIVTHLSATPRWSDSSPETPWREDAEQLRYAPPHWFCTEYYGIRRYWAGSFADRKHVVHGCSTIDPDYTPAATPDQLWQCVEDAWSAVSQEHIQSLFESMPRRVTAVISNNGGYSGY
ncbi:uncharacterized protein TNCV_600731 [Trichonephila clavipes]|nr:uncharacterized protein TNCV_600731 [Trichonephila clavipes]